MSDELDGVVLTLLRWMDTKIDRLTNSMGSVKQRLTSLEAAQALLQGDSAGRDSASTE